MKTIKTIITAFVLCFALAACNNNKHTEEARGTADSTNNSTTGTYQSGDLEDDFETTKREIKSAWKQRIDEIDREIDELDSRIEQEKGESKAAWQKRKAELKDESRELRGKMDDVDNTTEEKWESFKSEVERDVEDLGRSVKNFFEDNDKDDTNKDNNKK